MAITIEQFIDREVICCASGLLYELSPKAENFPDYYDDIMDAYRGIPDFREAAEDAGWYENEDGDGEISNPDGEFADSWEDACDISQIEPYEPEIFEHWIVSGFLASDLEERGHRILKDFFGFNYIWCRPTSGQSIALDSVIREIYADLISR